MAAERERKLCANRDNSLRKTSMFLNAESNQMADTGSDSPIVVITVIHKFINNLSPIECTIVPSFTLKHGPATQIREELFEGAKSLDPRKSCKDLSIFSENNSSRDSFSL